MKPCTLQHLAIIGLSAALMFSHSESFPQSHGYERVTPQYDYEAAAIRNSERMQERSREYLDAAPAQTTIRPLITPGGRLDGFVYDNPSMQQQLILDNGGHIQRIFPR